jgi:DNA-binding NtrC family response regulator
MAARATRTLLLVDDEPAQVRLVTALAARAGWRATAVADGAMALSQLESGLTVIDAVLIDVWREGGEAPALVAEMRRRWPTLPVLMVTAQASIALAVEAMRAGASDFLLKPIAPDRLVAALEAAILPDTGELRPLAEKASEALGFGEIVGSAPAFRAALAMAAKAARSRAALLVVGEAGTGKELIARAIHAASGRSRRPVTLVQCASLSPGTAEAELFGHERGAFPGAFDSQPGRIAPVDGGTLILADAASLPAAVQTALLGLIRSGSYLPLGSRAVRHVDVRVIALSTPTAEPLVPDLAACLSNQTIAVPSLAERAGDIPALARHLLARIGRQPGIRHLGLTDDAMALLVGHRWPGNVRQLHNALFRAAVTAGGDALTVADFPGIARASLGQRRGAAVTDGVGGIQLYRPDGHIRPLDEIEADVIRLAIGLYQGRMSEVARRLGIGRSTLYRKLVELGLDNAASG